MSKDILSAIQGSMGSFSKGQKLIARFILESYDKAAFMTASKLGRTVNVSESTVVRFAAELGYDGYPAMQKALQEMIRSKLTSVQRIEVSNDRIGNQDILSIVMQSDIEKIRMTLEETDREQFEGAVDAIVSARHIYILGVRSAAALSSSWPKRRGGPRPSSTGWSSPSPTAGCWIPSPRRGRWCSSCWASTATSSARW